MSVNSYLIRHTDRISFSSVLYCRVWLTRMEEGRDVYKVLVGKPEGKNHWGDQDVDGSIILRWILRKWERVVGTGWSWLRIGKGGGRL